MAGERKLTVILAGDHKGLSSAISGAGKDVDGLGSKIGGFAKTAAIGLGAAAVGAVAMGKSFVDAAVESQKVTKQTEAVLKSMGGQAGLTAKDVADLSTKLSMQSGVDDELIQSASNVLLTFGKVRNEVGKGNDIFTRAQKSALDMSVALGTDLQGATIMLGKALNDPVKGITAMSRAGVSFTQQQKDQIKAMVEAGDTLGAQKLIMAEMEKQFGGSAAAQATAGERLKVVWGNLQETLGAKLLPVVEKVAGFLAENLPGAIDAVSGALKPLGGLVSQVFGVLFQGDFKGGGPFEEDSPFIVGLFNFRDKALAAVAWFKENWPQISQTVMETFERVKAVILPAMETIGTVIAGAVDVIMTLWNNFGDNILEVIQRIWPRISQIIEGALAIIRGVVQTVTALIHGDWSGVWEGIKTVVGGVWSAIQGLIGGALEIIRGIVGVAMETVGSMIKGAWNGILDFFKGIPGKIGGFFAGLAEIITAPYRTAFNAIKRLWNSTAGGFGFSVPSWIPGVGGKSFRIPEMHVGGIVPGGLSNEPIVRLQGGEGVFTPDQMRALGGLVRGGRGARGTTEVHFHVDGDMTTESVDKIIDNIHLLEQLRGVRYLGA